MFQEQAIKLPTCGDLYVFLGGKVEWKTAAERKNTGFLHRVLLYSCLCLFSAVYLFIYSSSFNKCLLLYSELGNNEVIIMNKKNSNSGSVSFGPLLRFLAEFPGEELKISRRLNCSAPFSEMI